ncbi:hypothetical protein L911_0279 [Vibrio fluvialis I21563]|uniref:Uncharacterized protein n=1 Tax=Vibrio fluvialis PG41 TaxID=1336752 RepID=S7HVT3_VIBFL|nr:hypothetical protein L910_2621 [Vibrio fluvialis PG41]EPP26390.1 hypothetical protein L911_0279 [Vibrio fluvialis I21563]
MCWKSAFSPMCVDNSVIGGSLSALSGRMIFHHFSIKLIR